MPEIYIDKDGVFHYADEMPQYAAYSTTFQKPRSWDPYVVSYYKSLYSIRQLPISPIVSNDFKATVKGFFDLNSKVTNLSSEQGIFGRNTAGYFEKSWPTRLGIKTPDGKIVSNYFRAFDMASGGIKEATSKIISNIVCGRLFPTKMPYYIAYYNKEFGTFGLDLNHIDGVKSLRLDKYLESKGIELNSVASLMKAYKSGALKEDLTNSAIAQLMFGIFTLPNAIGEQDPNTRNAILLGIDKPNAKFDSVVRIDFENNRINDSPNQNGSITRSGDNVRVYPFGIYGRDENKFEFKENIVKAIIDKTLTPEDARTILSLHDVTKYATTSRTNIDTAVTEIIESHKTENGQNINSDSYFSPDKIETFAEEVITRADNYTTNVQKYFQEAADKADIHIQGTAEDLPPLEQ